MKEIMHGMDGNAQPNYFLLAFVDGKGISVHALN